ncbi:chloride channel protein [Nitratiruptor sp. SB155-2]|uniref:chloride channel protein n=1 Tax=Nitratiruptor sp. (strain SB155-2) TaxID=387092 RepID=UPI0001587083|nr:chloride channel protein [Nitratiruptor sp. SB155-2]BAF70848.1 voltage-gated chloride channel [Nitratiruptor sp. SB155-2]
MIRRHITEQTAIFLSFLKWMILSTVTGIIIGAIVTLFLKTIHLGEGIRSQLPFPYYYTLPFVLIFVVWLIKTFAPSAEGHGTEKVIEAVHKRHGKIDLKVVPIKLVATVLTLVAGGSVGKEGPAGQIGAASASGLSDLLRFSDADRKKIVICGISAGFASVFGTPIAGAIFGVEVLIIGVILYDVLLPSFIAGFAAFTTAQFLGIQYTYFDFHYYQSVSLDIPLIVKVIGAGVFFGLVSDIIVTFMNLIHKGIEKIPLNLYIKAFIAGTIVVVIGILFGDQYLGLGMETIKDTLNPDPYFAKDLPWYAFLLKTITSALTLGGGGSGGVITPVFYIGATSGHAFGMWFDYQHIALFAALGFVSVLAGATNAPIAATIMAVELFGLEIAHYAALSAVISFLLTGHRSIFPSQILAMRKSEMLEIKIGEEIEKAEVELEKKQFSKFQRIRRRILRKKKERGL